MWAHASTLSWKAWGTAEQLLRTGKGAHGAMVTVWLGGKGGGGGWGWRSRVERRFAEAEAGGDDAAAVVVVGRSVVVAASTARRMEILRRGLLCRVAPILSTVWGGGSGRVFDWGGVLMGNQRGGPETACPGPSTIQVCTSAKQETNYTNTHQAGPMSSYII